MDRITIKNVVFISNYFNHHQKPFSNEMYRILGDGYKFLEVGKMGDFRKELGYKEEYLPYVYPCSIVSNNLSKFIKLINEADVVIIGSTVEKLIKERRKQKRLIFRYSERPLKNGNEPLKYIPRLIKWKKQNPARYPIYMLCASAYTASDYAKFGLFKNKCYKWGYFTELKTYDDLEQLIDDKIPGSLIWVGRFIEWKHPEIPIKIAKALKDDGYSFQLSMIGNGPLLDAAKELASRLELENEVRFLGAMSNDEVRKNMEKSEIFLFTSNKKEGWGAVLNEAMNSACVPVASVSIGSVPYLISDNQNGLLWQEERSLDELLSKVKLLLDNQEKRKIIAKNAYNTIIGKWNGKEAAKRLLELSVSLINKEDEPLYDDGPCAKEGKKK